MQINYSDLSQDLFARIFTYREGKGMFKKLL